MAQLVAQLVASADSMQSHVGLPDEDSVEGICDALRERGEVTIRVWGRSMLPFVWPGACVTIHALGDEPLRKGDLVLTRRGRTLALHRLVDPVAGLTQGDAFPAPDEPGDILGRARSAVLGRWHVGRGLDPVAATTAHVAAPAARHLKDLSHPALRVVWTAFVRNRTAASVRRAIWPHETEVLGPRHLPLVKSYLLRRGHRPGRAVLESWETAARASGDRCAAIVTARDRIRGSLLAVQDRDSASWLLADLWVDRPLRGLGVSTELVAIATAEATRRGAALVYGNVRAGGAAWRANAAAGFIETGPAPHISPSHVRMERRSAS